MEFKKNIEFDKTVEAFKLMRLKDKHNVVIGELKEILVFLEMAMNSKDIKCEVLYNKEIFTRRAACRGVRRYGRCERGKRSLRTCRRNLCRTCR